VGTRQVLPNTTVMLGSHTVKGQDCLTKEREMAAEVYPVGRLVRDGELTEISDLARNFPDTAPSVKKNSEEAILPASRNETEIQSTLQPLGLSHYSEHAKWIGYGSEELKQSEGLFRSLLNSSADAIVIYDKEGRVQYVNSSFTGIFGWPLDEVKGKRLEFVPDSERQATMEKIEALVKEGTACSSFETKRYSRNGRLIDVSISASRYHDGAGRPAGLLVLFRDITEHKRAVEDLKTAEKRFRTLAEVAPFGIVILAANETTEYVNPKFVEILGYSLIDVPDLDSWFNLAFPDEGLRKKATDIWKRETGYLPLDGNIGYEPDPKVFRVRRKDGKNTMVSFQGVILQDGRVIATFQDVTAEITARAEIIREKNHWECTFHSVSDLIYLTDPGGKIVRVNRALAERWGTTPGEAVGMSCRDILCCNGAKNRGCLHSGLLAGGREFSCEISSARLSGVFDLRVSPLVDGEGGFAGAVHVARDITKFKFMETARMAAVHHLSHEIMTPVTVIGTSLRHLLECQSEDAGRQRIVDRMTRNLQRLKDIQHVVQEFLSPRPYRPERFLLVPLVQKIMRDILQSCSHRSVNVVTSLEPVESENLDPMVLSQILETLVKNAIENTPDEGEVLVSLHETESGLFLKIVDHGMGICFSDREFIFCAFHHTQSTDHYSTKTPFDFNAGGKGLELLRLKMLSEQGWFDISFESTRCHHILNKEGACSGRISLCPHVDSAEECRSSGGTIFKIFFPRTPDQSMR
jgi:PAS domain S-box-containing protein